MKRDFLNDLLDDFDENAPSNQNNLKKNSYATKSSTAFYSNNQNRSPKVLPNQYHQQNSNQNIQNQSYLKTNIQTNQSTDFEYNSQDITFFTNSAINNNNSDIERYDVSARDFENYYNTTTVTEQEIINNLNQLNNLKPVIDDFEYLATTTNNNISPIDNYINESNNLSNNKITSNVVSPNSYKANFNQKNPQNINNNQNSNFVANGIQNTHNSIQSTKSANVFTNNSVPQNNVATTIPQKQTTLANIKNLILNDKQAINAPIKTSNSTSLVNPNDTKIVFTVSQLCKNIQNSLQGLGNFSVVGEISEYKGPTSSGLFFSLKEIALDGRTQKENVFVINVTIFNSIFRSIPNNVVSQLKQGAKVIITGKVDYYSPYGRISLVATNISLAGEGLIMQQYIELFNRLKAEGLFDARRKKPLPTSYKRVALMTAPQGQAYRDVMSQILLNDPFMEVKLYPCLVQGKDAPKSLITTLNIINQDHLTTPFDAILVVRGGGSLEDLNCFNDEGLIRAIAQNNQIPLLCGVGHEGDHTLIEQVADHVLITPTATGIFVSSNMAHKIKRFYELPKLIQNNMQNYLVRKYQNLYLLNIRFNTFNPGIRCNNLAIEIQKYKLSLQQVMNNCIHNQKNNLNQRKNKLTLNSPNKLLLSNYQRLSENKNKLKTANLAILDNKKNNLNNLKARLDNVSPLNKLHNREKQLNQIKFRIQELNNSFISKRTNLLEKQTLNLNNIKKQMFFNLNNKSQILQNQSIRLNTRETSSLNQKINKFNQTKDNFIKMYLVSINDNIRLHKQKLQEIKKRLDSALNQKHKEYSVKILSIKQLLNAYNYHNVLSKGYTFTQDVNSNIIKAPQTLKPGDKIITIFAENYKVYSTVDKVTTSQEKN